MWPFTFSHRFAVSGAEAQGLWPFLKGTLVSELSKRKAAYLRTTAHDVAFMGGLFRFVASTNLLVAVSCGSVTASAEKDNLAVRYELSFLELFVMSVIGGLFMAFASLGKLSAWGSRGLGLFFFLFFFLVNREICIWRFDSFIKECMRMSTERKAEMKESQPG